MPRSESFADLNLDHIGSTPSRLRASFGKNADSDLTSPGKPFGLGEFNICFCVSFSYSTLSFFPFIFYGIFILGSYKSVCGF